jgi:hypothetical protein
MLSHLVERAPGRYLYDLVRDYPLRGGKGIRPSLLLSTCQAVGGSIGEALGPAVAIELTHNAFLVHDDVEDDSRQRRGRPTLHRLHGMPLAVNAGDALAMLALEPLRDRAALGTRLSQSVADEFHAMVTRTIEGQATELGWRADNVVALGPADYLDLIAQKTCWYTTVWPLRVGALIGSRGVRLSGGQVQRAAAARALVAMPELLVVDDLSSALDVATERAMWGRLLEQRRCTILAVAHRPATLARADQVFRMEAAHLRATS